MINTETQDRGIQVFNLTDWLKLIIIGFGQIGVGIGVVLIGSFLVAELKFIGWEASTISLYLGIATVFEVTRLFFGHLSDNLQRTRILIIHGTMMAILGLYLIPYFMQSSANLLILFPLIMFSIGSAVVSTLIDAHLTAITTSEHRSKIAGIIQTSRILGFAIGGVFGSQLYEQIPFNLSFQNFVFRIAGLALVFMTISILVIHDSDRLVRVSNDSFNFKERMSFIISTLNHPMAKMLYIFLIFYPLALFMQDFVLEAYAVENLNYLRDDIGTIVTISSILTLIFIPFGVLIESKTDRLKAFVVSLVLMSFGILGFILTFYNPKVFIPAIILFAIGSGVNTAPGFAYLLDVCSYFQENMTTMLAFSGLLITLGRSFSGIMSGFLLLTTENNYFSVFGVELLVTMLIIFPIYKLNSYTKAEEIY